jgi:hypothetical protein
MRSEQWLCLQPTETEVRQPLPSAWNASSSSFRTNARGTVELALARRPRTAGLELCCRFGTAATSGVREANGSLALGASGSGALPRRRGHPAADALRRRVRGSMRMRRDASRLASHEVHFLVYTFNPRTLVMGRSMSSHPRRLLSGTTWMSRRNTHPVIPTHWGRDCAEERAMQAVAQARLPRLVLASLLQGRLRPRSSDR